MPTFAFKDEASSSQESLKSGGNFFRNWLGISMQFLRRKKFTQKHKESVERKKEDKLIEAKAKAEAFARFESLRKSHAAQFKPKAKESTTEISQSSPKDLAKSWLEEYEHPSSTADISIHEVVGEGEVITEVQPAKPNISLDASSLDLSTTFNSTAKSLFSTSPLSGNAPSTTTNIHKITTDKLENYNGARPSFGATTITSTPVAKLFGAQPTAATPPTNNLLPKPTPAPVFTFTPKSEVLPSILLNTIQEASEPSQESSQVSTPVKIATGTSTPRTSVDSLPKEENLERKNVYNSLVAYYSKDLDKKEDNDIAKERFEKTGDPALLGSIKRSINGKLTIVSKKHATTQELAPVILFLANLINRKTVESYNGQKLKASDEAAVAYATDAIIYYCMGVVDRDNDLVHVIAIILRGISLENNEFESVLLGQLFNNSRLLTLDSIICTKIAEEIISNTGQRSAILTKEKSTIKLFMALHLNKNTERSEKKRLNMHHLWKVMAIILNTPLVVISTVVLTASFLEICADKMLYYYPKQWPKIVKVLSEQLLPLLENNLQTSKLCQAAGEAAYISVLCNELENL